MDAFSFGMKKAVYGRPMQSEQMQSFWLRFLARHCQPIFIGRAGSGGYFYAYRCVQEAFRTSRKHE